MPDAFVPDEVTRDKRTMDTPPEEQPTDVVTQTLSPQEDSPQNSSSVAQPTKHPLGGKIHLFTAFCEQPNGVTFEDQEENEKIILLLRKSFFTNISWIFFTVILVIIPLVLFQAVHFVNASFISLSPAYIFVLISLYYLVVASYAFISFITWYFNLSLITSQRVVDIDFSDLVYKNIAETKLTLVQDVSYTQTGVLRTMFDFGDVLIQTAGTVDNFNLFAVPNPDRIEEIVESLIGKGRGQVGV